VVPCDAARLAAALSELLATPGLGSEMGQRGRQLVAAQFRWDRVALALQEVYRRVLYEAGKVKPGSGLQP
jgi:glycosyltransferase involved in cell wall biosynthesis